MTVPSDVANPPRVTYIEDGATLIRAVPYTFEDPTDLVLTRISADGTTQTVLTLNTDYTVTGGAGLVGSVTMVAGGAAGDTLQIDRDTPRDQLSDYEDGDDFPAERVEGDFDKLTRIVQELARDLLHKHDIQQIIAAMLQAGSGITLTVNATGDALTIACSLDVYTALKGILVAGSGVTLTENDVLKTVTVTAASIDDLPDCVELSGDQQTNTGGMSSGTPLSTENVMDIVTSMLVAGPGVSLTVTDPENGTTDTIQINNTSMAGYTDENAVDAIITAMSAGALITITPSETTPDTFVIASTALDPSYRGLAVIDEAAAFTLDDSYGGKSVLYTGGAAAATLNLDATHALSSGWGTVIRNKGTGTLTLNFDAGVSIMVNGSQVAATAISFLQGAVGTINRWGANDFTLNGNARVTYS